MEMNVIFTISLLFAVISSVVFWGYFKGYIKRKNKQEEKYRIAEQNISEANRLELKGVINELDKKLNLLTEHVNATNGQLSQVEKKNTNFFKLFNKWFEMVNQRQSEIEDRLTLGMRRHQEIKNKIDALSNTNVNLQEKLLNTEKALGEEEAFIRSQRADMDTLILDVKTRIGDFDSNYQSFRKNEQDIESKIEQIASNLLEIENKSLNIGQMFGEKISSVAKTLDEKDSIFEAYQKEMNSIIQGLTGKINELGSHSEHHQRKFDEVSFKINAMSDTLTGIHETINSLKNDFMQKVNSSYSEIVNQMSSFKTKLDDQHLVNDQLEEKDRIIELQLKDIGETWEKLHEQLLAKYGEMLDAIEGGKSRVQTMEEKIMGITETEEGTKKSILGLLEEFTIIQKDLQSVKEEISMKKRGEKIVENKLDMIKKIINSAETELEKHR